LFGSFLHIVRNTAQVVEQLAQEILAELGLTDMGILLKLINISAELKDARAVISYAK
jgi:hypothetical protein